MQARTNWLVRVIRSLLVLIGTATIIVAISIDWLGFGGNPGFGLEQLALLLGGIGILLIGYILPYLVEVTTSGMSKITLSDIFRNGSIVIISTCIILSVAEIGFLTLGFTPDYPENETLDVCPWWICDDIGCRVDPGKLPPDDALLINQQGFHDSDEFIYSDDLSGARRILLLGDSFTWGASADRGKSWVDLVEGNLSEKYKTVVWNTGIPGAGTNQALATLKTFFPIMRPHIVILGFYVGNDFKENLYPLDLYILEGTLGDGRFITQYDLDRNFVPIKLSLEDAFYWSAGLKAADTVSTIEYLARKTRVGSLILRATYQIRLYVKWRASDPEKRKIEKRKIQYGTTFTLLKQLRDYFSANDSKLLILVIPSGTDLQNPSNQYLDIQKIGGDLSLELIELIDQLDTNDYTELRGHWNNKGHAKAGQIMFDRIISVLENEITQNGGE